MRHRVFMACLVGMLLLFGGCGGGSDEAASTVTEFDPNNRDRAAFWWAGLVEELAQAIATRNEVRVDETMKKLDAAREPLVGQRIRFLFNVWTTNPDLPETVWEYKPISSAGVWVGLLHRADPGRIRVGIINPGRGAAPGLDGVRAFLLKPGEHIDPAILGDLSDRSTFEISATITRTRADFIDTWHQGMEQFRTPPTLLIFINDIKVEKVIP